MSTNPNAASPVPTDDVALLAWVVDIIATTDDVFVRTPPGGIAPTSRLRDDLGIDSIGRVCVLYALADRLERAAEENDVTAWTTVGDVVAWVRHVTGAPPPEAAPE